MQTETIFRIITLTFILAFIIHRGLTTRKFGAANRETPIKQAEGPGRRSAALLLLLGLPATLAYAIEPHWIAMAMLPLPFWARWAGVGFALSGFLLLQWSQNTLGENWSDRPRILENQALITSGPYRRIRHPIYTAFLMILGSILLISSNWIIGLPWLGMTILEVAARVKFEETLMLGYFGKQYRQYMQTTGRILPRNNIINP